MDVNMSCHIQADFSLNKHPNIHKMQRMLFKEIITGGCETLRVAWKLRTNHFLLH